MEEKHRPSSSGVTVSYLQEYLKGKDFNPDNAMGYVLKLVEEVGELSRAIHKGNTPAKEDDFRGSIEEELWDVMYYTLCIANLYDIQLEKWIKIKEDYNNRRYHNGAVFQPGESAQTQSET